MAGEDPRAGLLIMRVEQQDEYVLITLTIEQSLLRSPVGAPAHQSFRTTEPDAALDAVREFLDSF